MSKVLTRADILAADDLKKIQVEVPEWGGSVYVRTMTGNDRDKFEDYCYSKTDKSVAGIMQLLLSMTLVDEFGVRLFNEDEIKVLGEKSAAPLSRLFEKARELNALNEKDVKDLEKN